MCASYFCFVQTYPATVCRDVDVALRHLLLDCGVTRCVVMGLCSGAYAAFQSAARLSNPVLIESILINPLTFFWQTGMTLDDNPARQLKSQHYYLSSALQPAKWWKLLSGKTNIGLGGILRLLSERCGVTSSKQTSIDKCAASPPTGLESHPQRDDLPADLASIVAAGRNLTLFFADEDPGYGILMHKAGKQANRLRKAGQLKITLLSDSDHTFSRRLARRDLIDAVSEHLVARNPG